MSIQMQCKYENANKCTKVFQLVFYEFIIGMDSTVNVVKGL